MSINKTDYKNYINLLPQVKHYLKQLEEQDMWWSTVAMVGKINSENIDPQLLTSIVETQTEFQHLRDMMIAALHDRYLNQANSEVTLKAHATIDMINRNLFERTADVGFLAKDSDLLNFMQTQKDTPEASRQQQDDFIHQRLEEYVAKYSVYDDIALIDTQGRVRARLQQTHRSHSSQDPLIQQALNKNQGYVEVYRHSDIFPQNKQSLIFAKRLTCPQSKQLLGVLCLSFRFQQEMQLIFETINNLDEDYQIALMDQTGLVLASDSPKHCRVGQTLSAPKTLSRPITQHQHFQFYAKAKGYEGYKGLDWSSFIQVSQKTAFAEKHSNDVRLHIDQDSPLYLTDLEETNLKVSTLLLIVILNGKITSLKRDVKAFLPILDRFQGISRDIADIFRDFIQHIHQVLIDTIQDKVRFSATLAMSVMDRNLYERANDCRWWALNSEIRQILSQHEHKQSLSTESQQRLHDILSYINKLYTVYTNILLFDRTGQVLAVSNPSESEWVGRNLPQRQDVQACLNLKSTQAYHVSEFSDNPLYNDKPTYIYYGAVKDWSQQNTLDSHNIGGIALVFDSTPQFAAMLADTEAQYTNSQVQARSFSLYIDPQGLIISSTHADFQPLDTLSLPKELQDFSAGKLGTLSWKLNGTQYVIGYQMTEGYREYKTQDGYQNPIIALNLTPI